MELIKHFEGFRSKPYQLPKEPFYTVGWGRSRCDPYKTTTKEAETPWLIAYIANLESSIITLDLDLNQNQTEALVSFAYNTGINALRTSTLVKRLRAKDPLASEELLRWVEGSHGEKMPGLVRRRKAEKLLFDS